jgi:hypothetical protein
VGGVSALPRFYQYVNLLRNASEKSKSFSSKHTLFLQDQAIQLSDFLLNLIRKTNDMVNISHLDSQRKDRSSESKQYGLT